MNRYRSTPPPPPPPPPARTIPPALRHAVRDGIIDPNTAMRLHHYLPHPHRVRPEDRVDDAARIIGKILVLATFTIIAAFILSAAAAGTVYLIRTITG